jgi:hypothetical protein
MNWVSAVVIAAALQHPEEDQMIEGCALISSFSLFCPFTNF